MHEANLQLTRLYGIKKDSNELQALALIHIEVLM